MYICLSCTPAWCVAPTCLSELHCDRRWLVTLLTDEPSATRALRPLPAKLTSTTRWRLWAIAQVMMSLQFGSHRVTLYMVITS